MSDNKLALEDLLHDDVVEADGDAVNQIVQSLEGINSFIASLHVTISAQEERISQLELYTSYLLSKDPDMKEKVKAMADAHEKSKA